MLLALIGLANSMESHKEGEMLYDLDLDNLCRIIVANQHAHRDSAREAVRVLTLSVMQATKGKANPALVRSKIVELLHETY